VPVAQSIDTLFDDMVAEGALWEPTIVLFREKTKLQNERGIDFFLKFQRNRIAESMRTVGQWILYEPVPHPERGQEVLPAGLWKASIGEQSQTSPPGGAPEEGRSEPEAQALSVSASGRLRRTRSAP
jgi:hypothetical protein